MEEILERQSLVRGRDFATFSTIEKALAGRNKSFRGSYVVQVCTIAFNDEQKPPGINYYGEKTRYFSFEA